MQKLRDEDLYKTPGIAETLDWARALLELGCPELDSETVEQTLTCLLEAPGGPASRSRRRDRGDGWPRRRDLASQPRRWTESRC